MTAPRKTRLADTLRAELSDIIRRQMRDPRFTACLLSITDVALTPDLKYATVYFSILGDESARQDVYKALKGAAGLLRAELSRTKAFKSVPELHFRYDESIERGAQLLDLIQKANKADDIKRDAVEHADPAES
ncbi:MAG: 30S ribosome-binding factor RbfA [Capsulimonadaceae bacterium]|nr:30S ribosome-binding factor RbfA [Capsulimonadaceae bacterium]